MSHCEPSSLQGTSTHNTQHAQGVSTAITGWARGLGSDTHTQQPCHHSVAHMAHAAGCNNHCWAQLRQCLLHHAQVTNLAGWLGNAAEPPLVRPVASTSPGSLLYWPIYIILVAAAEGGSLPRSIVGLHNSLAPGRMDSHRGVRGVITYWHKCLGYHTQ